MDPKGIFEALVSKFGDDVVFGFNQAAVKGCDSHFFVNPERLPDVARYLRDAPHLACDYLECVSGVDYPDAPVATPPPNVQGAEAQRADDAKKGTIHVVYHVFSYAEQHRAVVKVSLPREAPEMPTVSTVWSAANWQERECYDLLGVTFRGHPDLRRIMLPDDWVGHPLRKDYKEAPEYHGIPTTRPDPLELLTELKPKATPDKKPEAKPAVDKKPEAKPAVDKKLEAKP
ncbi:MAG: NADH-quinone oxidoreductase subunit C, partial [Polyangiaceae bacterium]|nr:NADH-quinone oxidoreductase subunit C [Polyangiaceae bacterium]